MRVVHEHDAICPLRQSRLRLLDRLLVAVDANQPAGTRREQRPWA